MSKPQSPPPKLYRDFMSRYPAVGEAYESLGSAVHGSGPLDGQTRELVKVGLAIGAALESAVHAHARLALEAGATPDEIRQVALLAATTLGFPTMMKSLRWVNDELPD